jgi:hypothetical protein
VWSKNFQTEFLLYLPHLVAIPCCHLSTSSLVFLQLFFDYNNIINLILLSTRVFHTEKATWKQICRVRRMENNRHSCQKFLTDEVEWARAPPWHNEWMKWMGKKKLVHNFLACFHCTSSCRCHRASVKKCWCTVLSMPKICALTLSIFLQKSFHFETIKTAQII